MGKKLFALGILISLAGCATQPPAPQASMPAATGNSPQAILQASAQRAGYRKFLLQFIEAQNQQGIEDKSGCHKLDQGQPVHLTLTLDKAGTVTGVEANPDSDKGECFKKAYMGAKMLKPPFAPIALVITMN